MLRPHPHPTGIPGSGVKGDVQGTCLSQANAAPRGLCAALTHWRCQYSAVGARTGRALRNCLHANRMQAFYPAIGEEPGAYTRTECTPLTCQWHATGSPLGIPPRRLPANGAPLDRHRPARSSSAVRALCAHQRQSNALPMAERAAQPFALAKGPAKGPAHRQKLFSTFFPNPLARSRKM